jgi:hypothetical protein
VLYEMLTGHLAFARDSISDTIAAILEREPDWRAVPAQTPAPIQRLLQRCLEKDARQRLRDAGDARIELDDARRGAIPVSTAVAAPAVAPGRGRTSARGWQAATAILAVTALGALAAAYQYYVRATPDISRFVVAPPENAVFVSGGRVGASGGPDYHAFGAAADGQRFLIPREALRAGEGAASPPIAVVVNWVAQFPSARD